MEDVQTLTRGPTMIGQITDSSTESPMTADDNEENVSTPMLVTQPHTEQIVPITDHTPPPEAQLPQQSNCIPVPTTKANPDNPPTMQVEQAVQ